MIRRASALALTASFRGAVKTADALAALAPGIEALEPQVEFPAGELEELSRVTAAHAIASAALRGRVTTMLARRGVEVSAPAGPSEE